MTHEEKKIQEAKRIREWRHQHGISKKYYGADAHLTSEQKLFKNRLRKRTYNLKRRRNGRVSLETLQLVYEENIKAHGTLTCYLCLKPVGFGEDCIEHKTPLVRGGTNKRENLDIAHRICNYRKNSKTEAEYREELLCTK